MSWYHVPGNQQDAVICTCVRMSRNLSGYPFPARLEAATAREIISKVSGVLDKNGFIATDFSEISRVAAESFAEKRFISPRYASESLPHALLLNDPCNLAVSVCEEDHVHIRCVLSGLALKDTYDGAVKVEALLDGALELAFDEKLGYLTASPAHIGTAMEVSVILALPLLAENHRMEGLARRIEQAGLFLRGLHGGENAFTGGLCRLSNRVTLGVREEEILEATESAVRLLTTAERDLRGGLRGEDLDRLTDRVRRAEGILRTAHLLAADETVDMLGLLRLGAAMGICHGIRVEVLTALLTEAMPATLTLGMDAPPKSRTEEDILRASVVRERIFGNT